MRKYWKWGSWEELGYDEEIQVPPETDNYNGPHVPYYEQHAERYQFTTSALLTESGGTHMGFLK